MANKPATSYPNEVKPDFVSIPKYKDFYGDFPPEGGLRHLAFHRKENGFKSAFLKIGGRLMIDVREFHECLRREGVKNG